MAQDPAYQTEAKGSLQSLPQPIGKPGTSLRVCSEAGRGLWGTPRPHGRFRAGGFPACDHCQPGCDKHR